MTKSAASRAYRMSTPAGQLLRATRRTLPREAAPPRLRALRSGLVGETLHERFRRRWEQASAIVERSREEEERVLAAQDAVLAEEDNTERHRRVLAAQDAVLAEAAAARVSAAQIVL